MNPSVQTFIALTLVVLAVLSFVWRWWQKPKKPGCGSGCGCASTIFQLKKKINRKIHRPQKTRKKNF